jgi:hypothetical protein
LIECNILPTRKEEMIMKEFLVEIYDIHWKDASQSLGDLLLLLEMP